MLYAWLAFLALVFVFLALDLGIFHRRSHEIRFREAAGWTIVWILTALAFNVFLYFGYDHQWLGLGTGVHSTTNAKEAALEFLAGYLVEKSLSLDNIFVFAVVFQYFSVPAAHQHRVLFWGILGALIMRGLMIAVGTALIHEFAWIIYVFAALLFYSAIKLWKAGDEEIHPDHNVFVKAARRIFPVTSGYRESHLFVRESGRLHATPLFLVLLVIESTDVLFAVDSVPAVFAVTRDPFLVFTSNIFAILGLRALYFVLAGMIREFTALKKALVILLLVVSIKMAVSHHVEIPEWLSLLLIGGILGGGIAVSLAQRKQKRAEGG